MTNRRGRREREGGRFGVPLLQGTECRGSDVPLSLPRATAVCTEHNVTRATEGRDGEGEQAAEQATSGRAGTRKRERSEVTTERRLSHNDTHAEAARVRASDT